MEIRVATVSGSCDTAIPASVTDADLELAAEAEPWAPLLRYVATVDGKPWRPSWSLASEPVAHVVPATRVFAECPGPLASGEPIDQGAQHDGLPEGAHTLRYEAVLPGVDGTLRSDEVRFELACAGAGAQAQAGAPASGGRGGESGSDRAGSGASGTAGKSSGTAGTTSSTADVARDSGPVADTTDEPTNDAGLTESKPTDDACTIAHVPSDGEHPNHAWLIALVAALVLSARRARQKR